jgi:hypothetical protein
VVVLVRFRVLTLGVVMLMLIGMAVCTVMVFMFPCMAIIAMMVLMFVRMAIVAVMMGVLVSMFVARDHGCRAEAQSEGHDGGGEHFVSGVCHVSTPPDAA